jgi:alanine racemase
MRKQATGNLSMVKGFSGTVLVNDVSELSLSSISKALDFLIEQSDDGKTALIISGKLLENKYCEFTDLIERKKVNNLIVLGEEHLHHKELFPERVLFFESKSEFMQALPLGVLEGHNILLKGAADEKMSDLIPHFEKDSHSTFLEVKLSALAENLAAYKTLLKPQTKMMAMVKAAGYGSGLVEVSHMLESQGVDYLGVAYFQEGIELRKAGINLPIMVLNPTQKALFLAGKHNLEPSVHSLFILKKLIESTKEWDRKVAIHIKLNTGMNRLGFDETDIPQLCEMLSKNEEILEVKSIYSHLAASGENAFKDFTKEQINLFEALSNKVSELSNFKNKPLRHICNTSGIERLPSAHFEMVRLGIGLYGETSATKLNLKKGLHFQTRISGIRTIEKEESVGYNRSYVAHSQKRIATLPVGYADGIARRLSNGGFPFWVKGKHPAHIVGNICMDMLMIDVTGIDCAVGDEVEIFGMNNSVQDLATELGTISYEVLTNIGDRVKRVFVKS